MTWTAERVAGPVILDGRIDEPAWQLVSPVPLTMHQPVFGGTPTEVTRLRFAFDDLYLYVAAELFDSEPDGIQVRSLLRDVDDTGDFVTIVIDPFNDDENAMAFTTTPAGARIDRVVSADAEGPGAVSIAWNGVWDVRTSSDSAGWYAEYRIPFSTLRYQVRQSGVEMGIIMHRLIGRKNERVIFPAIRPDWPLARIKPSQAMDVVFPGLRARPLAYAIPYTTARLGSDITGTEVDAGGDLKFGVLGQGTLDLTLNTDFAETEADELQVNLSRFPLFFPERRQFFLERAGVFDFDTGESERLFHSRRIGLTAEGQPVPVTAGGRFVGRYGDWDVGSFLMRMGDRADEDGEFAGMVRVRAQPFNALSRVGTGVTFRGGNPGSESLEAGVDGSLNVGRSDYVLFAAATQLEGSLDRPDYGRVADRSLARLAFHRRTVTGLGFLGSVKWSGVAWDPGLGFTARRGVSRFELAGTYGVLTSGSTWRRVTPSAGLVAYRQHESGQVEQVVANAAIDLEARTGAVIRLGMRREMEVVPEEFLIEGRITVPDSTYRSTTASGSFMMPPSAPVTGVAEVRVGGIYGGRIVSARINPAWPVSRHLSAAARYQIDQLDFGAGQGRLTLQLFHMRATWALDTRLSASLLAQFVRPANTWAGNLRVRYNFGEGSDVWLVLASAREADGTTARQLSFKLTRLLTLR